MNVVVRLNSGSAVGPQCETYSTCAVSAAQTIGKSEQAAHLRIRMDTLAKQLDQLGHPRAAAAAGCCRGSRCSRFPLTSSPSTANAGASRRTCSDLRSNCRVRATKLNTAATTRMSTNVPARQVSTQ